MGSNVTFSFITIKTTVNDDDGYSTIAIDVVDIDDDDNIVLELYTSTAICRLSEL